MRAAVLSARIMQTAENNSMVDLVLRYFDWISQVARNYWTAIFGA